MAIAISIYDTRTHVTQEVFFKASPVRIGRNALNDLLLDEPSVSQWHAQVGFDEQRFWFVDMGSSNGSKIGSARANQHEQVDITPHDELEVGPMVLKVRRGVGSVRAPATMSFEVHTMLTCLDVNDGADALRTVVDGKPGALTPLASSAIAQLQYLRSMLEVLEPARNAYVDAVREQVEAIPASGRAKLVAQLAREFPELGHLPEFVELARRDAVAGLGMSDMRPKEWAEKLIGVPLRGPAGEDISDARVLARVAALLQTFSQSLFELRRVKNTITRDLGLGDAPSAQPRSGQDILAYLLDFRVDGEERAQALMREFAEVAVHQIAMLSALREGVKELMSETAPSSVEAEERDARARTGGLKLLPLTAGRLWERYRELHANLVEGERFSSVIFGRRFAHSYLSSVGRKRESEPMIPAARPSIPPTREQSR